MTKTLRLLSVIAVCLSQLGITSGRELTEGGAHLFILSGQSNMRQPLPDAFTGAVESVFGKDKVLVVTSARPSQPIRKWYRDWVPPEGVVAKEDETQGAIFD